MNGTMSIKELIYTTGKGVEIQVWDDGTVYAVHVREPEAFGKAETVREALEQVIDKLRQIG